MRTEAKALGVFHNKVRQQGYLAVQYQRFQGRRGEVMEEEVRAAARNRRARSIQMMARWLELQAQANAEKGTPREGPACGTPKSAGQKLITSFLS